MLAQENQQATASWVTGILEGEGHFEQSQRSKSYRLSIANTNTCIIKAVTQFLNSHGILHNVSYKAKKTAGGRIIYMIYISGVDCRHLYLLLDSYLECRRDQYQKLIGASETERSRSLDLQWLIGIWQAEGSFCLTQAGQNVLKPRFNMPNTNAKIIEKVLKNINWLECPCYVQNGITQTGKSYTRVIIEGLKRCQTFLLRTRGLWVGKRDQMRTALISEYIESRLSKSPKEPYCEREMEIYNLLRDINY